MPVDLSQLFTSVRANNGDEIAQECLDSENVQQFDLQLESLSMSLQMELSRLQRTSLQKIRSHAIGKEIQHIVNTGLEKLIELYWINQALYEGQIEGIFNQLRHDMSPETVRIYHMVESLNLVFNFDQIAYNIQDLPYADTIRILKCILITTIQRRSQRRQFLTPN